jgi:hypothetical protein
VGLSTRSQQRWCPEALEDGKPGYLYDFYLFAQDGRALDLAYLLDRTRPRHKHLVHLCLDHDERSVRFTVPTVLGSTAVIEIVQFIYDTALYAARPGSSRSPDKLVDAWPEYVIGPRNPLTFLEPSMDCSFFSA